MKKIFNLALVALFFVFMITSCGENKKDKSENTKGTETKAETEAETGSLEEEIIGDWVVRDIDLSFLDEGVYEAAEELGIPEDVLQTLIDQVKYQMDNELDGSVITFYDDYTASIATNSDDKDDELSDWQYNEDDGSITVFETEDENNQIYIEEGEFVDQLECTAMYDAQGIEFEFPFTLVKE